MTSTVKLGVDDATADVPSTGGTIRDGTRSRALLRENGQVCAVVPCASRVTPRAGNTCRSAWLGGDKTGKKLSKQIWEIIQDIQYDDDDDNDDNKFESYCVRVDKDWRGIEYRRSIRNSNGGSRSKGSASGSRGRLGQRMERSRWSTIWR